MALSTPYYLIYEQKLLRNLKIVQRIRNLSGAKFVLALKCFSTWSVFELMKKYLDGTTSSSLYETRLGYEKFAKEVHAYSVAFSQEEITQIKPYADKIIFNSLSQLKMFYNQLKGRQLGLRVNPQISYSPFQLADPGRRFSRLGVCDKKSLYKSAGLIQGVMFHFNCENADFGNFSRNLDKIALDYGKFLKTLEWVSLGGGIYFTKNGYPVEKFSKKIKEFGDKFKIQVYLEPGEAVVSQSAELVTRILDIVRNEINIAIVDASAEAHMLDLLLYRTKAKIQAPDNGRYKYMVAGRSCLAGDIFGTYSFKSRLGPGMLIRIKDTAGYTMVKKNWFNGLKMPSIVIKRLDGSMDIVRCFEYEDFLKNLS